MKQIRRKAVWSQRPNFLFKTNAGVAGLLFGFILQIFSISGPLPDELLSQNSLQGDIPTWLGFVATVTVCGVVLNTLLPKLRARFF